MKNPNNFIYNSDYANPTIIWKKEAVIEVPAYDPYQFEYEFEFSHGLPFTPLLIGQYSVYEDFSVSYDFSVSKIKTLDNYDLLNQGFFATPEKAMLYFRSYSGSRTKVYVRIYGLTPPDYNGNVSPINDLTNFKFNSDFVIPKIVKSGIILEGERVEHGLPYRPMFSVWNKGDNGNIYPQQGDNSWWNIYTGDFWFGWYADSTTIGYKISPYSSSEPREFYYIIFGDKAE